MTYHIIIDIPLDINLLLGDADATPKRRQSEGQERGVKVRIPVRGNQGAGRMYLETRGSKEHGLK